MDLKDVKTVITATVNMHPKGLPVDRLDIEFRKDTNQSIPYARYGYNSLLAFIQNELAENIKIEKCSRTGELFFHPKPSTKSGHIVELKQQENNKKKKQSYGNPSWQRNQGGQQNNNQPINQVPRQRSPLFPAPINQGPQQRSPLLPTPPILGAVRPGHGFPPMAPAYYAQHIQPMQNAIFNQLNQSMHQQKPRFLLNQQPPINHFRPSAMNYQQNIPQYRPQKPNQPDVEPPKKPEERIPVDEKPQLVKPTISRSQFLKQLQMNSGSTAQPDVDPLKPFKRNSISNSQADNQSIDSRNFKAINQSIESTFESDENDANWDDVLQDADEAASVNIIDDANEADDISEKRISGEQFFNSCVSETNMENGSTPQVNGICNGMDKMSFSPSEIETTDQKYLSEKYKVGDSFHCVLSELNNPLKFWLQITHHSDDLTKLIIDMNNFYGTNECNANLNEFELFDDDFEENEWYAVRYDNNWYRACFEGDSNAGSFRTRFIDYGSLDVIKLDNVRRLAARFKRLPAMAICCALGNIRPIGAKFTAASAERLLEMTNDVVLYATVLKIEGSKLYIDLTNKSTKHNINQEFIRIGHAKSRPIRNA